jgi:DNA-binding HxlR family transcriptional regulator
MADESLPYRHGIHEAMGVLSGQWVTAVLASLTARPMTYSKLLEHINHTEERLGWVTHERPLRQKVLTDTLHRMQRDGLVVKIERPSRFGSTWYQLTPMGRSLLRALLPLAKWAEDHRSDLAQARAAHQAAQEAATKPDVKSDR